MYILECTRTNRRAQINGEKLAAILLELAGGGHTTAQTVKAMEYQHTLDRQGRLKVGSYVITRPSEERP